MSQQVHPELPVRLRRVRDSGALLFMLAFLGFLGYIIWDGLYMKSTDVNLVVHGHDSFGNICGRNNKPIKFSERSGQNYTSRPYTKYTLINSAFERYTLDSGRLKNGELIYVKEATTTEPEDERDDSVHDLRASGAHTPLTVVTAAAGAAASAAPRFKQEQQQQRQPQQQQATARPQGAVISGAVNGAEAVSALRERLAASAQTNRIQFNGNTVRGGGGGGGNRATTQPQLLGPQGGPRLRRSTTAGGGGGGNTPFSSFEPVELARTNRSLLNALRTNMMYQYPPMYGYSAMEVAAAANRTNYDVTSRTQLQNSSLTAANARGASGPFVARGGGTLASPATHDSAPRSLLRVSSNSGSTNNDSERFEHTFVTPVSVMTIHSDQGRSILHGTTLAGGQPGISQSEVPSQLLYLTECVASCPPDHVELIFYRCMPRNWRFSLFPNAINVTRTFIDDILTDVSHCYRELIYTFSLALVLSLGLLILLRYLASIIIWSCLALLIAMFLSMASYSWLTFYNHIMDLEHVAPNDSAYSDKLAASDRWLIGSIFLTFVAFATIGTVLFMRKRILLVTTLFRESGKAIADMPLLLLQPLLTFAALAAIMAAWLAGLVCLQSMKLPLVDAHTGFVVFRAETLYKIMKWYHIFAFLWVSHFAIACQHYVIGASVSKWYFSPNRYELSSPIGTSISELILYYLGSVALGSFLVAIFKVIRVITRQIQFLVQRSCMTPPLNGNQAMGGGSVTGPQSASAPSAGSCGSLGYVWRLFIWFFDNIVMIINRDAYVEIAIHGHSFLGGARRAFTVLASNPLRLLAIKSVGNVLLVIAKICVVVGTISMAYVLLEGKSQQLNYSWSPIVISALYAYVVAHWFLSVYEMVIDALFICYCEDYEQKNLALNGQINGSNFRAQILNNGQLY